MLVAGRAGVVAGGRASRPGSATASRPGSAKGLIEEINNPQHSAKVAPGKEEWSEALTKLAEAASKDSEVEEEEVKKVSAAAHNEPR